MDLKTYPLGSPAALKLEPPIDPPEYETLTFPKPSELRWLGNDDEILKDERDEAAEFGGRNP